MSIYLRIHETHFIFLAYKKDAVQASFLLMNSVAIIEFILLVLLVWLQRVLRALQPHHRR